MRTLKKTLCLVLCLVMMAGLCCFGVAAADFTDAEEIQYAEAVDVLSGIGVIKGYEQKDGSFNFQPEGTLTRAEACTIIAKLLGGDDLNGKCSFTDIDQAPWAEGYIAFCESEGIVAGYGDGTFGPNDTLTGSQWGKMVICALGYDAANEGIAGDTWEIAVAKLVKKLELSKDFVSAFDGTQPISREEACQIAFNALWTKMVEYENGGTTITTGSVTITTGASAAKETDATLADNFTLKKSDSQLDEEGYAFYNYTAGKKAEVISEDYYTDTVVAEYKGGTTGKEILSDLGITTKSKETVAYFENGMDLEEEDDVADLVCDDFKEFEVPNGLTVTVAKDKDGNYKALITIGVLVKATVAKKAETSGDNKGKYAWTFAYGEEAAKLYDEKDAYTDGAYYYVVPAVDENEEIFFLSCDEVTPIEAKATKYNKDDATVVVKGTTYEFAMTALSDEDDLSSSLFKTTKDYYVVDGYLYLIADVEEAEEEYVYDVDGYCYVEEVQVKSEKSDEGDLFNDAKDATCAAKAKVVFTDSAAEKVIDLAIYTKTDKDGEIEGFYFFDKDGNEATEENAEEYEKQWFGYTVENGVYTLVWDEDYAEEGEYAATKKAATAINGRLTNSATVYTYINVADGTIKTVTGIANIEFEEQNILALYAGEKSKVVDNIYFIDFEKAEEEDTTASYAYIAEIGDETANGTEVTAYVDGKVVTYYIDNVEVEEGYVYKNLEFNSKNVITKADESAKVENGEEVTLTDKTFYKTSGDPIYYAKDVAIYDITEGVAGEAAEIEVKDYVVSLFDGAVIYIVDAPAEAE